MNWGVSLSLCFLKFGMKPKIWYLFFCNWEKSPAKLSGARIFFVERSLILNLTFFLFWIDTLVFRFATSSV